MTAPIPSDDELEEILGKPEQLSAAWVLRPTLKGSLFPQTLRYAQMPTIGRLGNILGLAALNGTVGHAGDPFKGARFTIDDSNRLWMWNTTNQRRAFGKFVAGLEDISTYFRPNSSVVAKAFVESPSRLARSIAIRQSVIFGDKEVRRLSEAWTRQMEFLLLRASQILDLVRPSAVVIANQHTPKHRALISAARHSGIPTVYLPHAPMATNRQYADLPVDYASAFGIGEVEALRSLGADTSRVRVCGNPSVDVSQPASRRHLASRQLRIVAAPSPIRTELLQWFFSAIRSAYGDDFDVCLHPRLRSRSIKHLVGANTNVIEGSRTADYIRNMNCIMIHMNSGVGLEAQALGVPTINLIRPEMSPNYYYLCEDSAVTASSDSDLEGAIEGIAKVLEANGPGRSTPVDRWLGATGEEAEIEIGKLLAASTVQVSPILDGWA